MALPTLLLGAAFLVDGDAVGLADMVGTTDLAGWVGLGLLVASLVVGVVWTVAGRFSTDRTTGALEPSWASPARRETFVVGSTITGSLFTLTAGGLLIGLAIVLLGADYDPGGAMLAIPVPLTMLVGVCGFGYLAAAVVLRLRRAEALLDGAAALVATFSGVAFPLTVLPLGVRAATYFLPTMWGLDLLRHLTLDARTLLPLSWGTGRARRYVCGLVRRGPGSLPTR